MTRQGNRLLWILGLLVFTVSAEDFQCIDNGPSAPTGTVPHMPTVTKDSDSYQATVEVNILDKGYSYVVDEFLDYEGNRALMRVYKGGLKSLYIFSYDTDEVFSISNDMCAVSNISESRFGFLMGAGSVTGGDRRHIFGSAAILRFAADNHDVYNGTSEVRGVPADVYSTCITWQGVVGKARATYYFSQAKWNTSAPRQQLPLRIEVEGLTSFPTRGQGQPSPSSQPPAPRYFHHVYDFINYLPYVAEDTSIFLTPPNVDCENRVMTRSFPKLDKFFNARFEEVDPLSGNVQHRHLWYDQEAKMTRIDFRWEPPGSGQYTNGITRIGDFNTGIEYVIDHKNGCSIRAQNTSDLGVNAQQRTLDGKNFFTVAMKDPSSLFYMNQNYTYVGQRKVRNILCDVFIASVSNFTVEGTTTDATFEYHYLASNWQNVPIHASQTVKGVYPVQLVINVPKLYWTKVFNYFDYTDQRPLPSDFDISSCFDNSHRVKIQLTFPGSIDSNAWETSEVKTRVHYQLAETMKVNPVRIAGVHISRDFQNVFVSAWLLDTVNAAQFEKNPKQFQERVGDATYTAIASFSECADLCANHKDFQCNGLLYCSQGKSCRLSKAEVVAGNLVSGGSLCDAYSRTIMGPAISQPSLQVAYDTLTGAIQQRKVQITIEDPEGFAPLPFTAIGAQIISGSIVQDKPMPSMSSQFFYRVESVLPALTTVANTYVWYDGPLKLFRYDYRYQSLMETVNIHDFNTGVAYTINQVTQECTISTIGQGQPDAVNNSGNSPHTLELKSALDMLFIDGSYKYIGQSTVRGIPCDVFEARRTDYQDKLSPSNNTNQISIFKLYFQSDGWKYFSAEAMDITKKQIVRLDIEDRTTNSYRTYSIFDYNDERHAFSFYDTSACYEPEQRKSFAIVFKDQSFHPTLDAYSTTFLNSALLKMSSETLTSPIRFQKATVTYDDSSVYLLVTALGTPPPLALFYKLGPVVQNMSAPQELALFVDDCAAACVQTESFICYGFDFCNADSDSPSCLLSGYRSKLPTSIAPKDGSTAPSAAKATCTRYIRSENVTAPMVSSERILQILTDLVYDGMFEISITPPNQQTKTYVATDIRDDILRPTDPESASGSFLRKFKATRNSEMKNSIVNIEHDGVSITDCAMLCLQENTFKCEAFDYHFSLGTCRLSSVYPKMVSGKEKKGVNVYTRLYTSEYTKYDAVLSSATADRTISNVSSAETCAKACTEVTDFRCEAFEVCTATQTCSLRKTHQFGTASTKSTSPAGSTGTPSRSCIHYSRNRLYDYVRRDHKLIKGHDDAQTEVTDVSRCAYLCASGEVLAGCASFEATQLQHGNTKCVFSTADPTNTSLKLTIDDSLAWALYTRANSLTAAASSSTSPSNTDPNTYCSKKDKEDKSETNIRIGIAFGTLILGALLGVVGVLVGGRIISRRYRNTEDLHGLSTWKH